jgi:hypothetical protein
MIMISTVCPKKPEEGAQFKLWLAITNADVQALSGMPCPISISAIGLDTYSDVGNHLL